jgi:hypothetical protein
MTDPLLRRIERRAVAFAVGAAVIAFVLPGGGWRGAAGVMGGALLVGTSYWAIRAGVAGLTDRVLAAGAAPRRGVLRALVLVILRYALLAGMAYVMIARLRLPPMALLLGASVLVAAAALELIRGTGRS